MKILHCSLSLPILYLSSLVTVCSFCSLPIPCAFSLPSHPLCWDKIPVLGLAWTMSASSPCTSLEASVLSFLILRRSTANELTATHRLRILTSPSPWTAVRGEVVGGVASSLPWLPQGGQGYRHGRGQLHHQSAWTLAPLIVCGSSWTTFAAHRCRSTHSSTTHHLLHSLPKW